MCKVNFPRGVAQRTLQLMRNRIRALREEWGWTQGQFAMRIGVSRQTVNAVERGRVDPGLRLAFKMARIFGLGVEDIFDPADDDSGNEWT